MHRPSRSFRAIALTVATLMGSAATSLAFAQESAAAKHEVDIPPIGARPANQAVPKEALGPSVDPRKGYRIEQLGRNLYMVTDNAYHGEGHEPGNIFIYAPEQKTLMAVDLVFPGWIPFRRFAVAHDVPGWLAQVELIATLPFETLVGGHVARVGTRDDVLRQIAFDHDVKDAVAAALHTAPFIDAGTGIDAANPWALTADYTARVAAQCVRTLAPKWRNRLGGFDAFVWDPCYAMEQSLRVD